MEAIRLEDLSMMYKDALVLYKNKPVYVLGIGDGNEFRIFDLFSQMEDFVKFSEKDFAPPTHRIGTVNVEGSCVYVCRNPVRKYSVGFNDANVLVKQIAGAKSNAPFKQIWPIVARLRYVGIANAMFNIYPAFYEAVLKAAELGGCVAWDKQFCVDVKRKVFYKDKEVGFVPPGVTDELEIEFNSGYKHLILLFKDNYTKSLERCS